MTTLEDPTLVLTGAAQSEVVVTFEYPKSGRPGMFMLRTVSPYEVKDGKVLGWDHDREGLRHFSLARIASNVEFATDAEYVHPTN
jgi:predicted DNA-binding transcriptional regulator YafY